MQIDFNLMEGICKMLEIIAKHDKARTFAYILILLIFISVIVWLSPAFLNALGNFISILRQ